MKKIMTLQNVLGLILFLGGASILGTGCSSSSGVVAPTPFHDYGDQSVFITVGSSSYFVHPTGVVYVAGKVWVTDQGNNSLQQFFSLDGSQRKNITSFNGGDTFNQPWGLAQDPATGNLYVAGGPNGNVVIFDKNGNYLNKIAAGGSAVRGVAVNSAGTTLYVVDYNAGGYIYTIGGTPTLPTLTFVSQFGTTIPGQLTHAEQCVVDPSGNLWVADYKGVKVEEYDPAGTSIFTLTSTQFKKPTDVFIASDGDILVSDENTTGKGRVYIFDPTGTYLNKFGYSGALQQPEGVTQGGGYTIVTDWVNQNVQFFD